VLDYARYWEVPMPFRATAAWMKAHPPAGLEASGSESGTTHGVLDNLGYSYSEPDTDAWVEAQYEVAVVPDGAAASYLRIDGTDNWLDPVPRRDEADGNRLHVRVGDGCPASDSGYGGVNNSGSGLAAELLPPGPPSAGLICVYDGANGKPFGLVATKPLDGEEAAALAAAVSKISLSHLDDAVTNCPLADGAAALVAFSYSGRADVDLWYARNGCQSLANGHIVATPDQGFIDDVNSLSPAAGSPIPGTG
jgi:hypothetical protein